MTETLSKFYEGHRAELFVYALALTGSRAVAEDVVHDAFARILGAGRLPAELRPYVFRCIRNASVDLHRARLRHGAAAPPENGRSRAPLCETRLDLETALGKLHEDEREVIVLKTYAGFTFSEIAALRGVPLNTAASWYRRGLEKLRNFLEEAEV